MSRQSQPSHSKRSQKSQRRTTKKKLKTNRGKRRANKLDTKQALDDFFGKSDIFPDIQFHGNIKWRAKNLARIALLFSWSEKSCVTDAFAESMKRCKKLGVTTLHKTYQGFMGALTNYVHIFIPLLILRLQHRMQELGGEHWEISGFVPIAFDGSRNSAARSQSNEQELCSAKSSARKTCAKSSKHLVDPKPQAWITLMWHMGVRLPWDWRLGPSDSSERKHAMEMIEAGGFPENTLFCGDAGFVGYDFWNSMITGGYHFVIRVGGNVKLIGDTVDYRRVGGGRVLCWPKGKQESQPPLVLRLAQVTVGKTEMFLLTSVLDPKKLDHDAMAQLYEKRWGIEIEFRGLKQTLNGSKLRCRNSERVYTELHWSILSMAVAELLATKEQVARKDKGSSYTPKDRSLANTMRAIYDCLDELNEVPVQQADLFSRLASAVTDNYQRNVSKKARYRPKRSDKKKKKLAPPEVRKIEKEELEKMKNFELKIAS
jgi:hypothetical protein